MTTKKPSSLDELRERVIARVLADEDSKIKSGAVPDRTPIDVFRVLLELMEKHQDDTLTRVVRDYMEGDALSVTEMFALADSLRALYNLTRIVATERIEKQLLEGMQSLLAEDVKKEQPQS